MLVRDIALTDILAGETRVVLHGLELAPDDIRPDRASPIVVDAVDALSVTFRNPSGDAQTATFRCQATHSVQRAPGAPRLLWQGADAAVGPQGPQGDPGPEGPQGDPGPPGPPGLGNPVDYVDFLQPPTVVGAERRLLWNDADGTLDLGLKGGLVTLQIGTEITFGVRNMTGAAIADGAAVYANGANGNKLLVAPADADNDATVGTVIGVVTEHIDHLAEGYVTVSGKVHDLDTHLLVEGAPCYLGTTPGQLVATPPALPAHSIRVGICLRAHNTQGVVHVAPMYLEPAYELTATVTAAASPYAAGRPCSALFANASAGPVTIVLPQHTTSTGHRVRVKKIDAGPNAVVVQGSAGQLIDGAASVAIGGFGTSRTFIFHAGAWWIV